MITYRVILCAIIVLIFVSAESFAYKETSHQDMSEMAAMASMLSEIGTLNDMGLLYSIDDDKQRYLKHDRIGDPLNILRLIRYGASFEDTDPRALNHFYNPLNDQPLFGGALLNTTSPNWALEDRGDITFLNIAGEQVFSYKDARGYFYNALTVPAKSDRDRAWGLTFQSLGQIVHHVQDMAQPQHVRNDAHLDKGSLEIFGMQLNPLHNPSLYESWTLYPGRHESVYAGYAPVYSDAETAVFTSPRKFWTTSDWNGTDGMGLAEYTNRGFFSAGTIDDATFPSPADSRAVGQTVDIVAVCAAAASAGRPACPAGVSGQLTFYTTTVSDSLRPSQTINPRALSNSLYDDKLLKKGRNPVFALNRFNIEAAQDFLLPRAVAYSAGLINYFFRGKMEITLPDEGIYGVVDHSVDNQKDVSGFRKIKLKLRNVTPGGTGIEPMYTTGKLVAVAKFHRNNCYQPNLSGEYGSPGMDWHTCRSENEDIVVSQEIDTPIGINDQAQPLAFTFLSPIPINATDIYLQVVYRGGLGEEEDAVVVATKDIAEPQYQWTLDTAEQIYYPDLYGRGISGTGHFTWGQSFCDLAYPPIVYGDACKYQYRSSQYTRFSPPQDFDPYNPIESFKPIVSCLDVPMSSFSRIAFLGELNNIGYAYYLKQIWSRSDSTIYGQNMSHGENLIPEVSIGELINPLQVDPNTNQLTPAPFMLARGVYGQQAIYSALTTGDVENPPLMNPLTPMPCIINF